MTWRLMVHGGCGAMRPGGLNPGQEQGARAGLDAALDAGQQVLADGGSSLDAVEAAARVLEDDPLFNAGRGSVLNYEGGIDLDAAIMDGRTRDAGAVAGLKTIRCPISLARAVMEKTGHVLLSFEGAEQFAREHGFETVDPAWFETADRPIFDVGIELAAGGQHSFQLGAALLGLKPAIVDGLESMLACELLRTFERQQDVTAFLHHRPRQADRAANRPEARYRSGVAAGAVHDRRVEVDGAVVVERAAAAGIEHRVILEHPCRRLDRVQR
jgi:hypothetical protein